MGRLIFVELSRFAGTRQDVCVGCARRGTCRVDVGAADCVFDTRNRCIRSRAANLFLQVVEESPKIALSIHFSDGNVAHDGRRTANVRRAARAGFGEGGDGNELLVLHSRYEF